MTGVHGQARPTAGPGGGAAGGSPLDALAEAIGIQGQTIQIPAIARIPARDVPLVVVLILAVVTLLFGWKILAVAAGELPPMPSNTYAARPRFRVRACRRSSARLQRLERTGRCAWGWRRSGGRAGWAPRWRRRPTAGREAGLNHGRSLLSQ